MNKRRSNEVSFKLPEGGYKGTINARGFALTLDEPENQGGTNQGMTPMDALASALAGCIGITLRMYADRKEWKTGEIFVEIYSIKNDNNELEFHKNISFENDEKLTKEQKQRLYEISSKCPVSKVIQAANPVILD